MNEQIKNKISEVNESFKREALDYAPSYAPTQAEIIDLVDSYWVSKYRDNQYDETGFLKPFYNVVINSVEIAMKMIDLDTKDVRVRAEEGQSYYPAWLFGKELNLWMKEKGFGKLLNKLTLNYPKYGTIVVKKVGNEIKLVPIQNIICNPTVEKLTDDFFAEKHEETVDNFIRLAEKHNWDDSATEEAVGKSEDKIVFYETYGELPGEDKYNIVTEDGIVLYSDNRDFPYKELHWDKIDGRWLGRGQVERLFEAQIQLNKVMKYKSSALHWTSKRIWQTRDDTIKKNLMSDVRNGDLLFVNSEVNPVSTEERNLGAYREEEQRWDNLISKLGFAYPNLAGERSPAGTPLGSDILQTRMASNYFDVKQEELGMFIKEILMDWIIPEFVKEKKKEHKIMLGEFDEDELTKLRNLIFTNKANKEILNLIKKGKVPSAREMEMVKGVVKSKVEKQKELKIPKGYYDNLKYKIDVIITNEQVDVGAKMKTLQSVMTMIASNPTILQDPKTKKVFYKLLDLSGISPTDFEQETPSLEEQAQVQAQRGGGMPRIAPATTPIGGVETRTL